MYDDREEWVTQSKELKRPSVILRIAAGAVVIGALYLSKGLLIPLTMAILLSFLLSPMCNWLERRGFGRFSSVLVTVSLCFTLIGTLAWTAVSQIASLSPKIPEYQSNVVEKLSSVNAYAVSRLSQLTRTAQAMGEKMSPTSTTLDSGNTESSDEKLYAVRVVTEPSSPLEIIAGLSGSFGVVLQALGALAMVAVLVVFFLVQREDLRDRFIRMIGKTHTTVTTLTIQDAGKRVTGYLSMLFLMNLMFGVSIGIGLYFIGLPNAILWGILAAVLRFIPYIGPWIAAAMPVALSMAISTNWLAPLLTVGLFFFLELINNNLLEPWLYGKNTGVSSVAVLVAASFWMWLWGPIGLLLATPLTVCCLVVGKHVPELSFLSILLGNEPVFEQHERVFQRLAAGESEEAAELIGVCRESQSLTEVYDTVLIPVLGMAQAHHLLGKLTDTRYEFVMENLQEVIQEQFDCYREVLTERSSMLGDSLASHVGNTTQLDSTCPSVLVVPAHSEADEIAARMLAQALAIEGYQAETISLTSLQEDLCEFADRYKDVNLVCISAMSPTAFNHARTLSQFLRSRRPEINQLVGLWKFKGDIQKATMRIGGKAVVVTTLQSALENCAASVLPHNGLPNMQTQTL